MNVSIETMAEKFKQYSEYRIVYHIRPDGDCTCSSYALALALKSIGAKCEVVGRDPIPSIHRYMTDKITADTLTNPVYVAMDSVSLERLGTYSNEHYTFCIDHHQNNSIPADYKYTEPDSGACSEVVFKIIKAMGVTVTKELANLIFTAIVTDTMSFRTTDTRAQTFEIAAELSRLGADVYRISRLNTFIKTPQRMKIENILRDSFKFICNGKIATGIITLEDLKTADILDADLEGINSLVEQIEGVKVGATLRELPDGRTRCSVRSNGKVSANEVCTIHGGGGHIHAACCELDCTLSEAREIIENTCKSLMEREGEI